MSDEKVYDTLSYSYHNELIDGREKGDFLNVVFRL